MCPFCVRQRHWTSWECSKGWEQAACMSREGSILCVLLADVYFPSPYLKSAMLLFPPTFPGSLQLLLQLWQTTEQNSNQGPCSAMFSTQKKLPAKSSSLKLSAVCWSVYLARLMLFYLLSVITYILGEVCGMPSATYTEFF